jgi:hypothetical protein
LSRREGRDREETNKNNKNNTADTASAPTMAVITLELGDTPAAKLHGPLVVGGSQVGWRAWQWLVTKSGTKSEAQRDP